MQIAIIGAGSVGQALATSLLRAGHQVVLSAADPAHAQAAAQAVGASAAPDVATAARDADIIILAVPYAAAGESVAAQLAPVVSGKIVIDATNPLRADYSGLATADSSGAERFADWLPGAKVVKAFNTVFASTQARPSADIPGFLAGDDAEAKQQVSELIASMGFTPLDVGALSAARYLEGMAFLNISLNASNGWDWTSAWKLER
jgi:predicted dinucleotide-binding enzyme